VANRIIPPVESLIKQPASRIKATRPINKHLCYKYNQAEPNRAPPSYKGSLFSRSSFSISGYH
jgi:hypothetical protein